MVDFLLCSMIFDTLSKSILMVGLAWSTELEWSVVNSRVDVIWSELSHYVDVTLC